MQVIFIILIIINKCTFRCSLLQYHPNHPRVVNSLQTELFKSYGEIVFISQYILQKNKISQFQFFPNVVLSYTIAYQ